MTYRPLFGRWTAPLSKPVFSDVKGVMKVSKNDNFPELEAPPGWQYVDKDWILWSETSKATSDPTGWMYGKTYEDIQKSLLEGRDTGSEIVKKTATVRRRKWTRTRICVSDEARDNVISELLWLKSIVERLKTSMRQKRADHVLFAKFEASRAPAYRSSRRSHAHQVIAYKSSITYYSEQLTSFKTFMKERRDLDREYGRKLGKLSKAYLKPQPSSNTPHTEDGLLNTLDKINTMVVKRHEEFSIELGSEYWPELDNIIEKCGELQRKCDVEALGIWNCTRALEANVIDAFKQYETVYTGSCRQGVQTMERITSVLAVADATGELETGGLSDLLTGGIYGSRFPSIGGINNNYVSESLSSTSSSGVSSMDRRSLTGRSTDASASLSDTPGESFGDVFLAANNYRLAVIHSMKSHDDIQKFTISIEQDTRELAAMVAGLLRRSTEFFCDHQGEVWSDIGRRMSNIGYTQRSKSRAMYENVVELGADKPDIDDVNVSMSLTRNSFMTDLVKQSPSRQCTSSLPQSNLSDNQNSHSNNIEDVMGENDNTSMGTAVDEGQVPIANATEGSESHSLSMTSQAQVSVANQKSQNQSAIFDMQTMPPTSSTTVATGTFAIASRDDVEGADPESSSLLWRKVILVITVDGLLHIFKDNDEIKSRSETKTATQNEIITSIPVRSLRLDEMNVQLAMLPAPRIEDTSLEALDISLTKQVGSSMAEMVIGAATVATRGQEREKWETAGRILVHAQGDGLDCGKVSLRDWIRLLYAPLADPDLEPPHID